MPVEVIGSITVNSEPGASSNSYASVARYKEILGIDPYKDISLQDDEDIAKALLYATSYLDGEIQDKVLGELYNQDYALLFPRTGINDYRGVAITDYSVFPEQLIKATIYQAWWVTQKDIASADPSISGVKRQDFEGLGSQEFFEPGKQMGANKVQKLAKEVPALMDSFIIGSLSGRLNVMMRG